MDNTPPSVRLALPTEAEKVAGVQRQSWTEYAGALSDALLAVSLADMTAAWERSIARPPDARCRVLVAINAGQIVGFATTQPCDDDDAEPTDGMIGEFAVSPVARRQGHGSRLLHACVDTLRADGFRTGRHWLMADDDARRQFLVDTGWAPDGAHRELGDEQSQVRIKQVRVHTDLSG